ncbi:MAG: hypothetical protein LBQ47_08355 [Endomicrobium sp.]|jgi:hypothetical protein|nr:hypothetical protein [Endomicrobium sp.]
MTKITDKYQNALYCLALSLTHNCEKSKKAAIAALEKFSHFSDGICRNEELKLYKNLISRLSFLQIKKKNAPSGGIINSLKNRLGFFDKKVFVLKYESGFCAQEICFILGASAKKVKKSLLKSTNEIARLTEDPQQ